jgi:hypothetical protein
VNRDESDGYDPHGEASDEIKPARGWEVVRVIAWLIFVAPVFLGWAGVSWAVRRVPRLPGAAVDLVGDLVGHALSYTLALLVLGGTAWVVVTLIGIGWVAVPAVILAAGLAVYLVYRFTGRVPGWVELQRVLQDRRHRKQFPHQP